MSLVKFNKRRRPFADLVTSDFFDMEDFFDNRFWNKKILDDSFWNGRSGEPALNIKEHDTSFEIELAAPGFAKEDFDITLDNGYLNISAKKSEKAEKIEEDFTRREFSYNSFDRSLMLPESVKEEDIKAKYKNGILSFKLEKKEESKKTKPKKVMIT